MRTRHVPVRFMAFFAAIAAMLMVIGPVDAIADAASPSDVTWNFNPSQNSNLVAYEGTSGTIYDESRDNVMNVDATNGKFSPRKDDGDTQVNANTTLSFTAEKSSDGATVTVNLSGGSTAFTVTVDDADQGTYNGSGSVSFDVPAGGG